MESEGDGEMRVDVITERRKFNLTNITEEEGLILRTLLNQSDGSLLISIMADKPYWEDDIKTDGLTFSDYIGDIFFFGFDSAHSWNDKKPESKTRESVKQRTIELANEMVKKGI